MFRFTAPLLCLLASLPAGRAAAQDAPAEAPRPRVGLVLSGGGARGLAHVGVLKALEELRIPVDAIAGTSMGAVVGGLYASGMTAAEIEKLMRSLDWSAAFRDRPARNTLNFRRKQDDREFLVRFPLGIQGGDFRLPRGLIQGQRLTQTLRVQTMPVAAVEDFDELPTPFRAVAADLETGERVVLERGDLTSAMRASMSAPGVFAPVEVDGRLLVDGGIVENLPVDVAKSMGVDIVIAVDVGFLPVGRKELTSALAVSNQAITIMMLRETGRQRALLSADDVLILPELGSLQSTDFAAAEKTIDLGLAAMRASTERLARLSLAEEPWQAYLAARAIQPQQPVVHFVRTDLKSERYSERIQAELGPVMGQPLDPQALDARLSHFYGSDNFEALDYRLVREGVLTGIEVSARRKSWGPNFLRFGLELQDDFQGNSSFSAGVRAQVTEVNRFGAEWQTDAQVGANPLFRTEFYQPIGYGSNWFVVPRLSIERQNLDIFEDDRRLATYRVRESAAEFDFGREFGSWGELRGGVIYGDGNRNLLVGDSSDPDLPPRDRFDRGEFMARFAVDLLNDVFFPRDGELFTLQWNAPAGISRRRRECRPPGVRLDARALLGPQYADCLGGRRGPRLGADRPGTGLLHARRPVRPVRAFAGPDQRAALRDRAHYRVPAYRQRPGRAVRRPDLPRIFARARQRVAAAQRRERRLGALQRLRLRGLRHVPRAGVRRRRIRRGRQQVVLPAAGPHPLSGLSARRPRTPCRR